jgi:anti-sigma regulatory factor (Ser/Thr protein kinase)
MSEMNLTLVRNKEAARISRSRLSDMRTDLGPRYDDVALVISELVSNSVRHAGDSTVSVSIKTSGDRVRIEVRDGGPCFDIERPRGSGMGLNIVDRIADAWGVDRDGACTVWVEMVLPQPHKT